MKLVIDISEGDYKSACKREFSMDGSMLIYNAIREGTEYKERPHGEWIPCSERLPDRLGDYLVTNKYGNVYSSTLDYVLDEKCFGYEDDYEGFVKDYTIIAWMPLPEPYEKEGEAE